jgi:hypothetical protein
MAVIKTETGNRNEKDIRNPPRVPIPDFKAMANKSKALIQWWFYTVIAFGCAAWVGKVISNNCDEDDKINAFWRPIIACSFYIAQDVMLEAAKKHRFKSTPWTLLDYHRSMVITISYCVCAIGATIWIWWSFHSLNRSHQEGYCRYTLPYCSSDYIAVWYTLVIWGITHPICSAVASIPIFHEVD